FALTLKEEQSRPAADLTGEWRRVAEVLEQGIKLHPALQTAFNTEAFALYCAALAALREQNRALAILTREIDSAPPPMRGLARNLWQLRGAVHADLGRWPDAI